MKKLITLLFLIGITNYGNSQFLEKLKKEIAKSAKDAVTKKTKKETEKKVEKTLDKVLNPKLKKKKKSDEEKIDSTFSNAKPEDFMKPGKYNPSYTFNMTAHTTMVNYKKRKNDTTQFDLSYSKTATGTSVPDKKMLIITDWENESSIMLDDNQKTAHIISLSFLKNLNLPKEEEEDSEEEETDFKFEKTGKTKQLNGYTCHQYIGTSKKEKMEMWFAPDLKYSFNSMASNYSKLLGKKAMNTPKNLGYLMEMIKYKKGKKEAYLLVTKIEKTPYTIKLKDYTIQK